MLNPRWLGFLIIALICYSITFLLFPKVDPAARWNVRIDRKSAITRARDFATRFGLGTSSWTSTASSNYNREDEYYLSKNPGSLGSGFLSPLTISVKLKDPRTRDNLRVTMNSQGEIIGYQYQKPSKKSDSNKNATEPVDENISRDQHLAEEAIKKVVGSDWNRFSLTTSRSSSEGRIFLWTASDPQLKLSAHTVVQGHRVNELSFDTNFTPQAKNEYDKRRGRIMSYLSNAENLIIWPSVVLVIILFFIGLAMRRIPHRVTLTFLVVTFLLLLITNISGTFADSILGNFSISTTSVIYWAELVIPWLFFGLFVFVMALILYLYWSAGLAQAIRLPERKTIALELLLQGKLFTRPVVGGILAGLLTGGVISVIHYLVAASGLFQNVVLNSEQFEGLLVSRSPALASFVAPYQLLVFIVFSFLAPLAELYIQHRFIARMLIFLLALLCLLGTGFVYVSVPALVLTTSLIAIVLTTIYYRFDLLAVMVSCMACSAALSAAMMMAQGNESFRTSGIIVLSGLGILTVISLLTLKRAREPNMDEVAVPASMLTTRAERERLKAEFDVARRAQQQMLPDALPQVRGLEIAAVCQPSREVGGDLFDFINMKDGRLAIVVADVSGKGVPASLYMTLTKGLLDSIAEEKTDPGDILREVNRHLYEVCQRKVFVTLFLGIIDPLKKTLDYARAGHNPPILLKASDHQPSLLKSPGMGLGLNNGSVFDNSLKVSSIQLESNDILFIYSDGISEAMNSRNEQYGEERLISIASTVDGMRAEEARDLVMYDVRNFLGSEHQQDDQTLVVVRVTQSQFAVV